jgi:hypothetical protein
MEKTTLKSLQEECRRLGLSVYGKNVAENLKLQKHWNANKPFCQKIRQLVEK